jgi:AhpD family alkylhydroperoxidase
MATLQDVEWEECLLEPRRDADLEREVRKVLGFDHPVVPFFAPCPWLARVLGHGNLRNGQLVHLDFDLADLIFLAVSQDNSCRYCYAGQRALLRILGFDAERIRRVEEAAFSAEGDRREGLALDFARRISRSNPPPSAADRDALRGAGYSDGAVKEITYVASCTVMANRITTLPAVPTDRVEGLEDRLYVRLLRPLLARRMRSRDRRGKPEFLPPELKTGPFAYVGLELDGLPAARILREISNAAWSSPILAPRAKGLVFAVVARGLASRQIEREATGLLAEHGLDEGHVAEILSNLASPALDPIEAAIVPFARETIRVRPIEIQRRARKLLEELSGEQFLELVGVVGLANAICRTSLVLCET